MFFRKLISLCNIHAFSFRIPSEALAFLSACVSVIGVAFSGAAAAAAGVAQTLIRRLLTCT